MPIPTPKELSVLLLDTIQDPKIGAVKDTFCVGRYLPRVTTRSVQVDLHLKETSWNVYGKFSITKMGSEWGDLYFIVESCSFTRETHNQHMLKQTLVGKILDAFNASLRDFGNS